MAESRWQVVAHDREGKVIGRVEIIGGDDIIVILAEFCDRHGCSPDQIGGVTMWRVANNDD